MRMVGKRRSFQDKFVDSCVVAILYVCLVLILMNGLRVLFEQQTLDWLLTGIAYCLGWEDDTSRLSTLEMICLKTPRLAEQSIFTSSFSKFLLHISKSLSYEITI